MKIIHTGDLHLGSKLDSKFDAETSEKRKLDVLNGFERLIDYAKKEDIHVIILAGDVFDGDKPNQLDRDFFNDALSSNPDIDFLYLRGNHDRYEKYDDREYKNLKLFTDTWSSYTYGDVVISGIEKTEGNKTSMYSDLRLEKDKTNIVCLHGPVGNAKDNFEYVDVQKLDGKFIDYLALGHIHDPMLFKGNIGDVRGVYAYCGCLVGRGFDEIGPRGFNVIDTSKTPIYERVILDIPQIREVTADITDATGSVDSLNIIKKQIDFKKDDIYRVHIKGDISYDISGDLGFLKQHLKACCAFVDIKIETIKKIDVNMYLNDPSIKGEFLRAVNASDLSENDKKEVIYLGIKALDGGEVKL